MVVGQQLVEDTEASLGRLQSNVDPKIAAEVPGRVLSVAVEAGETVTQGQVLARLDEQDYRLAVERAGAEVRRLEALIAQQQRQVERYQQLVKENFFSANALDEIVTQLAGTREQLAAARTQLAQARKNLDRTAVKAPAAGVIAQRLVSPGDYAGAGNPLFQLSTDQTLRVVLPFPESLGNRLEVGQTLRIHAPMAPEERVEVPITEIRPVIGAQNRAIEVLAEIRNPGGWRAGGSVTGEVVLVRRENAVVVPPLALIRRPAGTVVYVITDDQAIERPVTAGVRSADFVEILDGLKGGETIAVEGASYLSDGAKVRQAQERGT
ncbi:MAG TPA: efflux RND transporter periplasmic adaptor subunit [Candidatus Macondimonas sp.]|nr:efflux RND transporter periplasmic adaptor subunit [Candidatus Macondimonas sp.]